MHFSHLILTTLLSSALCAPMANSTSAIAPGDGQLWYTFNGGAIADPRKSKTAPKQWRDPIDVVPKGYFSMIIENGQANLFAQALGPLAPKAGFWAKSFAMCKPGTPTSTQAGSFNWMNFGADSLVFSPLYIHAGNQCSLKVYSEQFDNTWIRFRGNTHNIPNAHECGNVQSTFPGLTRARRCIFPL